MYSDKKKSLSYGDVNFRGQSGYSSNYGYRNNGAVGGDGDARRGYGYPHHQQQQPRNPHYNQHDYRGPHNHNSRVDQRQSYAPNSSGGYRNQYQPSSGYRSYSTQSSSNYNKGIRTNTESAPAGSKTQPRKSLLPTLGGSGQQRKSLLPTSSGSSRKSLAPTTGIQLPKSSAVPQKVETSKPKEKCVTFSDERTEKPQTCELVSDASLPVASDVNNSEEVNSEHNSTFTIEEENNEQDPLRLSESSKTVDGQVQCFEEIALIPLPSVTLYNNEPTISEEVIANPTHQMDSAEVKLLESVVTQIPDTQEVKSQPHGSKIIETPVSEVATAENVESDMEECDLELVYPESPETFHEANQSIGVDEPEVGNETENKELHETVVPLIVERAAEDTVVAPIVVETATEDAVVAPIVVTASEEFISTETLNTSDPEQETVFSTPLHSITPTPQIEDDLVEKLDDLCITPMKSAKKPRVLVDSTNIIESSTIKYVVREVKKKETVDLVVTPVRRSTRIKGGAEVADAGELPSAKTENVSYLHATRTKELLTTPTRHSTAVMTSPDVMLAMNAKLAPNPYLN